MLPRVVRRGEGPPLLLIHGTAADWRTWSLALGTLKERFTALAYDRRCDGRSTEAHAADAAEVARAEGGAPILICGASYGGVVALELAIRAPELVAGLVLCEPPMPSGPWVPAAPIGFGCAFERLRATAGGPAAAEMFLRSVMGDAAFDAMPEQFKPLLCATYPEIAADMRSLGCYHVDVDRLRRVTAPSLLLSGDRSLPYYRRGLDVLEIALPRARSALVPRAGHAMHVDAHRAFGALVIEFARDIGYVSRS